MPQMAHRNEVSDYEEPVHQRRVSRSSIRYRAEGERDTNAEREPVAIVNMTSREMTSFALSYVHRTSATPERIDDADVVKLTYCASGCVFSAAGTRPMPISGFRLWLLYQGRCFRCTSGSVSIRRTHDADSRQRVDREEGADAELILKHCPGMDTTPTEAGGWSKDVASNKGTRAR